MLLRRTFVTWMPRLAALALSTAALAAPAAQPWVHVEDAWARASVPGQKSSGAFMRLTAREPLRLVGAHSPAASFVEVHEMKMEGDVMRMRAVPALPLPAGQPVALRPGGFHLMLMELKTPLRAGERIPLTLLLRDARDIERRLELQVPVSIRAPAGGGDAHGQGHGHSHEHPRGHTR